MTDTWTTPNYGNVFKNDRLILFRPNSITVIKPWPPAAWKRTSTQKWQSCRPQLMLDTTRIETELRVVEDEIARVSGELPFEENVAALEMHRRRAARLRYELDTWRAFRSAIPEEALRLALSFRERQFALLSMLARCPGAMDLAQSNPVLAWAVSTNWIWHRPRVTQPMRAARRLVLRKRREIAEWLGFPGTDATVRILAKYPPEIARIRDLFYLRKALTNEEARRRLGYLPRLNASVIRVLSDDKVWPRLSPSLLEEISLERQHDSQCAISYVLADVIDFWRILGNDVERLKIRSLDHLVTLYRELDLEMADLASTAMKVPAFPPPPLHPLPNGIEPISTPAELKEEGILMKNCVSVYAPRIVRGLTHLFRVLQPERATLSIVQSGATWVLDQCLKARNKEVSPDTLKIVLKWLADQQNLTLEQVVPLKKAEEPRLQLDDLPRYDWLEWEGRGANGIDIAMQELPPDTPFQEDDQ